MGLAYSRSEQHYKNEFSNPIKETKQQVVSVRLTARLDENGQVILVPEQRLRHTYHTQNGNGCDIMREIREKLREKQKVLIVDIYLVYIENNLCVDFIPEIENLVDKPANVTHHPDGQLIDEENDEQRKGIKLLLPGDFHGPVPEAHRVMFELPDSDVQLLDYAGMEEAIFGEQQTFVPLSMEEQEEQGENPNNDNNDTSEQSLTSEFFPKHHPLAVFCTRSKHVLNYSKHDFREVKNKSGFLISHGLTERVRRFFSNTVFGRLSYTRFEDIRLVWNLSDAQKAAIYEKCKRQLDSKRPEDAPQVFFQLQVDYVLVSPGRPEFQHKETVLGF